MAALVQTLPPQTTTVTMIGRPSSSGGYSSQGSQGQMRNHQPSRYNNLPVTGYRGVPATGLVSPYAFTTTPQLAVANANNHSRQLSPTSGRSLASSRVPLPQVAYASASQPSSPTGASHVDSGSRTLSLNLPDIPATGSLMLPSPPLSAPPNAVKPSPDRYRRNTRRIDGESGPNRVAAGSGSAMPSGSGMAAVGSLYSHPSQSSSTPSLSSQQSYRNSMYGTAANVKPSSADDLQLGRSQSTELAARYRRRSFGSIETAGLNHASDSKDASSPHPNTFLPPQSSQPPSVQAPRPPTHRNTPSSDSAASSRSVSSQRSRSVSVCINSGSNLTII